jgi:hypothetical protein
MAEETNQIREIFAERLKIFEEHAILTYSNDSFRTAVTQDMMSRIGFAINQSDFHVYRLPLDDGFSLIHGHSVVLLPTATLGEIEHRRTIVENILLPLTLSDDPDPIDIHESHPGNNKLLVAYRRWDLPSEGVASQMIEASVHRNLRGAQLIEGREINISLSMVRHDFFKKLIFPQFRNNVFAFKKPEELAAFLALVKTNPTQQGPEKKYVVGVYDFPPKSYEYWPQSLIKSYEPQLNPSTK